MNPYLIPKFKDIPHKDALQMYPKSRLQILPRIEEVAYMLHWLNNQNIWFRTGDFDNINPSEYYSITNPNNYSISLLTRLMISNTISKSLYHHINDCLQTALIDGIIDQFEPYIIFRSHMHPAQTFVLLTAINNDAAITSWKTSTYDIWSKIYYTNDNINEYKKKYGKYYPFFPSEFSKKKNQWQTQYYPKIITHNTEK